MSKTMQEAIQHYYVCGTNGPWVASEHENGEWVKYSDHTAALAARAQGAEVEPVAWQWRWKNNSCPWDQGRVPNWVKEAGDAVEERALYIIPPAPQPAEITAQQAAKVLLDIYDNGHHPEFRSIVLASAFGSEAYDKGMDRFQGTSAMARAFLTAIADPSSPDLDYLRTKNQPAKAGEA